nr:hypothetical protein [Oceanococcus sp. HetDA_MAG_MS8]
MTAAMFARPCSRLPLAIQLITMIKNPMAVVHYALWFTSVMVVVVTTSSCSDEINQPMTRSGPTILDASERSSMREYHWASYEEMDFIGLRISYEASEPEYCELNIANNMRTQGAEPIFYYEVTFGNGSHFYGAWSYSSQAAFGSNLISQDSFLVQDNEWYNTITVSSEKAIGVTTVNFFSNGSVPTPENSSTGFGTALSIECESELTIRSASLGSEGRVLSHSQTEGTYARVAPAGNTVASATIDGQYSLLLNSPISGIYFANMNANLSEFRIDHPQGVLTGETGLAELGTSDTINVEQGAGRYTLTLDRIGGPLENMYFVGYGMNPMDLAVGQLASTAISPSAPPESLPH